MPAPLLATKLYVPPLRPRSVPRPRLVERLNDGLAAGHRLTLVSAPAGFGKTTLVGAWVAGCGRPVAWLSLDAGDSDPGRLLTYLVAALQTVAPGIGEGILAVLGSPQQPPLESTLTALLNDIAGIPGDVVLVLDDYHVLDARPVDDALAFLVEHLPPRLHLVIATREDPALPLSRLRARGQLTELRGTDLRFTPSEAAGFLNGVMGLNLSADEVAVLEARTEGWIAGLQLAAISLQDRTDVAAFIASFAGSNRFVLDYLLEEVLQRQPERVQAFLLRTSILDRLCGPLCDAVLPDASTPGQDTLEYLDRANLFVVRLDSERRWYRYHHLFAELLRQRRGQMAASFGDEDEDHLRASEWLEGAGLEIEAFQHAAAGHDIERAERLIEGTGMPLHARGAAIPILHWLESLPTPVLDARPSLWVTYASVLLNWGYSDAIEPKLRAAERALQDAEMDDRTRDLVGRIASVRAFLAWSPDEVGTMIAQSRRALEYLHPDNLSFRASAVFKLGHASYLQGDRAAARRAFAEVTAMGAASGNPSTEVLGSILLGHIQTLDNELVLAAGTLRHALELAADLPPPRACEAHLAVARVLYQWNDLEAARHHGEQGLQLARQTVNTDIPVACELFLAQLARAQGDVARAAAILAEADQAVTEHDFLVQVPNVAAGWVLTFLRHGDVAAAARVAETHDLPLSRARVYLAQEDPAAALRVLEPYRVAMVEKAWADEELKALVLMAVAFDAHGERAKAVEVLDEALTMAEPGGFIRMFIDEGGPMARLLYEACSRGIHAGYVQQLLAAFPADEPPPAAATTPGAGTRLVEPLSARELEVLALIADGLTNQEIAARLYLSLHTVKTHARNIYAKLVVSSRTQAAARGRVLGLLPPGPPHQPLS